MAEPIFYSFRRCPYAMRARLALAVSGTCCELREVRLSAKPEALLAASPKGTVPVLVLADGEVLDQSIDIMRRVLTWYDPEGWLDPDDPSLIAANDSSFKHDLDRYKYPERYDADPQVHRESGMAFLRDLESRLTRLPYLCGATRGLADAPVIPFVRQFAAVDPAWYSLQHLPRVKTWKAEYLASDLFSPIMVRPTPWLPGDAKVVFPVRDPGTS